MSNEGAIYLNDLYIGSESRHVETVVLLSQRKADDYIEVELKLDELDITSEEVMLHMRKIKKDDYIFLVDIEKTRKYYSKNEICECSDCQYLRSNIKGKFMELEVFLEQFGIDISNFDEASCVESDGEREYIFIGYTVCGKIYRQGESEIKFKTCRDLTIGVDSEFSFPNNQEGEYFSLSLFGVNF